MSSELEKKLYEWAEPISKTKNADVLVYAGELSREYDDDVIDRVLQGSRRENLVFFVTTYGGDPDAAYRIARTLRRAYKRVSAVVAGFCKSAGTLLVLGADELVMFEHAELGPLDVQVHEALQSTFLMLKISLRLSTKTAGELATRTVGGLYGGIYAQFDPLRLGEIQRAQAVALHYGRRLVDSSQIATHEAVKKLVSGYPSHGFVIDRDEATDLFSCVREPTSDERGLEDVLHPVTRKPFDGASKPVILYLDKEVASDEEREESTEHASQSVDVGGSPSASA